MDREALLTKSVEEAVPQREEVPLRAFERLFRAPPQYRYGYLFLQWCFTTALICTTSSWKEKETGETNPYRIFFGIFAVFCTIPSIGLMLWTDEGRSIVRLWITEARLWLRGEETRWFLVDLVILNPPFVAVFVTDWFITLVEWSGLFQEDDGWNQARLAFLSFPFVMCLGVWTYRRCIKL
jgi:hypothetical protein